MKKSIALALCLVALSLSSYAQKKKGNSKGPAPASISYTNAIGIRGGWYSGISFKHFMKSDAAIEVIGSFPFRGFVGTVLYEKHANAFNAPNLNWFYGIGGHVGTFNKSYYYDRRGRYEDSYLAIGLDGILGLEYHLQEEVGIPFAVSVDIKPTFDFIQFRNDYFWDGALSIRYTF